MQKIIFPKSPTLKVSDEGGYSYVETSDEWKTDCAVLPCFAAMHWPDYDTTCIEDKINGRDVVIQLWKGTCQQFLGLTNWPRGIGAEVGVYVREPAGRPIPALDFLPLLVRPIYAAAAALSGDHVWWPEPSLVTDISFVFTNPVTNKPFFAAGPQKTYWRNRWMSFDSFARYDQSHETPKWASQFKLRPLINGKTYPEW